MFFRGSRYEAVPTTELTTTDDRVIRYKRIRLILEARGTLSHEVSQEDRLDLIAYKFYNNPELFWRIADANLALRPEELVTQPGRRLMIPLEIG